MGAQIPPSGPLHLADGHAEAAADSQNSTSHSDHGRVHSPITRREHISQALDDAFLNIIWVGAIPPVPLLSAAFVAYVQTNMIRKICTAHGVTLRSRRALAFSAVGAGGVGAFLTQTAAQSLRLLPGLGLFAGAPLQIMVNAAGTYAVGRMVDMRLSRDGEVGSPRMGGDRAFVRAEYHDGLRRAQQQLRDIADQLSTVK